MPKATLRFDLLEEREEFDCAVNGLRWKSIVKDIDEEMRKALKYGTESKTIQEEVERLRTMLREQVLLTGLNMEENC